MALDWISSVKIADMIKRGLRSTETQDGGFTTATLGDQNMEGILPETNYMYYSTQAWGMLQKCWRGYKIAKAQDDFEKMEYYAEGIRRAQKELHLPVDSFPDLGIWDKDVNRMGSELGDSIDENESCGYESEAQRRICVVAFASNFPIAQEV